MIGASLKGSLLTAALASCGHHEEPGAAPTFAADVAPVIYEHCGACHHPQGSAPFALLDHESVAGRGRQLVQVVESGFMPPWLPAEGDVAFAGERRMSAAEIDLLRSWVEAGAPLGDPAELPTKPTFPDGWTLGEPDLVVPMPEPYVLAADGPDVFRNFVLPTQLGEGRWVRAVEIRPGNLRVTHHAELFVDPKRSARLLDRRDAEPGFHGMAAAQAHKPAGQQVGWTPGKEADPGREDLAWRLEAGADLVLQLHLLPSGKPETIRAQIGLHFADEPPTRHSFLMHLGSTTLDIPAGDSHWSFVDSWSLPVAVELLELYPHAHYLGKSVEVWAELGGAGGERLDLLSIPEWDFNWQDAYQPKEPLSLPAGTLLRARYAYDNSAANPRNPHRPPRRVLFGPDSTDEMGDLWIQVLVENERDLALLSQAFLRKEAALRLAGYEQAARLQPEVARTQYNLGMARLSAGRAAEAVPLFERALALDAGHLAARYSLGVAHFRLGDLVQAARRYAEVLGIEEQHPAALNNLGNVRLLQGSAADAKRLFQRALALQPDFSEAQNNLGAILLREGDAAGAAALFESVLSREPWNVEAHNNLGATLVRLGELERAGFEFRRALELNPGDSRATANLERLRELAGDGAR